MFRIFVLGTLLVLTQAEHTPGHGVLAGYCNKSDECAADECCISFIQPRGKRTIVTSDLPWELQRLVKGKCHRLAANNETCYVPGGLMPSYPGLWYDCPCAQNLHCKGTGMNLFDKGELGYCTPTVSARTVSRRVTPCASGADCGGDECCVSNYQPGGKRALLAVNGHCMPLGTLGSSCLMRYPGSGQPISMVYQCPCQSGLTCQGTGLFDMPLGEVGKCA